MISGDSRATLEKALGELGADVGYRAAAFAVLEQCLGDGIVPDAIYSTADDTVVMYFFALDLSVHDLYADACDLSVHGSLDVYADGGVVAAYTDGQAVVEVWDLGEAPTAAQVSEALGRIRAFVHR